MPDFSSPPKELAASRQREVEREKTLKLLDAERKRRNCGQKAATRHSRFGGSFIVTPIGDLPGAGSRLHGGSLAHVRQTDLDRGKKVSVVAWLSLYMYAGDNPQCLNGV